MYEPTFIPGNSFVDDRGTITSVNDFKFEGIKRFYTVENHTKGFIRAFHGHLTGETFVYTIAGTIQLIVSKIINDNGKYLLSNDYKKVTLSHIIPGIYYIPAMYANGTITLSNNAKMIFFSTTPLENYKQDDIRFNWDYLGKDIWNLNNYR